jgi:hypothetical protein
LVGLLSFKTHNQRDLVLSGSSIAHRYIDVMNLFIPSMFHSVRPIGQQYLRNLTPWNRDPSWC